MHLVIPAIRGLMTAAVDLATPDRPRGNSDLIPGRRTAINRSRRRRILAMATILAVLGAMALAVNLTAPKGPTPGQSTAERFVVDVLGERFVISVIDAETIRLAHEDLEGLNRSFPSGDLAYGDGGFNTLWSWHLRPETVRMVQFAIEVCDGSPSQIEQNLTYWVETVGFYCPWNGRIVKALGP